VLSSLLLKLSNSTALVFVELASISTVTSDRAGSHGIGAGFMSFLSPNEQCHSTKGCTVELE